MSSKHITVTREEAEAVIALAGQGSTVGDLAEVLSTSEEHVVELLERVRAGSQVPLVQPAQASSGSRTGFLIAGVALVCFALGAFVQSFRGTPTVAETRVAEAPMAIETAKTGMAYPVPSGSPTMPASTVR